MAAITTNIYGYLYKSDGTKILTGNILISLTQDFLSIEGHKVAPFLKTASLSGTGLIDFDLFATANDVTNSIYGAPYPLGVAYTFEFDPAPLDQSIALMRKDGYWRGVFSIPHVSDTPGSNQVSIGALIPVTSAASVYSASYLSTSSTKLLTQEAKDILVGGVASNADALHIHNPITSTVITLQPVVTPPTATTDFAYIYMTTTGTTPSKVINLVALLEDDSEHILVTVTV